MEVVKYAGWDCARFVSGEFEALVTLDVGPRVIRLGRIGGPNLFHEKEATLGKTGGTKYEGYGGHRLWIAPESDDLSYYPENERVEEIDGFLASKVDKFGLQRQIKIVSLGDGTFDVDHQVSHQGSDPIELAPWALSVMTQGGTAYFPMPPFQSHDENYLPVAPLVLWSYTNFADPRWTFSKEGIQLRQDDLPPQKAGMFIRQGWCAYQVHGELFLKRFEANEGGNYPDHGCNFETFTRQDMLEVETLSELTTLHPGQTAVHRERWSVSRAENPATWDELHAIAQAIGF